MLQFWYTMFNNVYADSLEAKYTTLEEFADFIRATGADEKTELPLVSLGRYGSLRAPPTEAQLNRFGPNALGALRHDGNLQTRSGVHGDYDRGQMSVAEALTRLEGAEVAYILYTTPS